MTLGAAGRKAWGSAPFLLKSLTVLAALAGCTGTELPAAPGPVGRAEGFWREQIHWVPVIDAAGETRLLYTRVCRPQGNEPATAVVINHGKSGSERSRAAQKPAACAAEAIRWFTDRGYVAVLPLRRGYGVTGGVLAEADTGCASGPRNYTHSAAETARDIGAAVNYAASLPYVRPTGIVVVGQSVGGLGTIAYAATNPARVSAMINFAGGGGGHMGDLPDNNCQPEKLAVATDTFGHSARTPMLWIYAKNDSFFSPAIANAMWQAFTTAGGRAELHQLGPYDGEGHSLFYGLGGSAIWGNLVETFLRDKS